MSGFIALIPARYASTRLPGKPLMDLGGKPMVVRVAERAQLSGARAVWVVTDDRRIMAAVEAHGCQALLTSTGHASGTDRLAEAANLLALDDDAIVVNVQGDEPLMDPELIYAVARELTLHPDAVMATACHAIEDTALFNNPNVVKVVTDNAGYALYFSRAPIPWPRDAFALGQNLPEAMPVFRHIGLYAYRAGFLRRYADLSPAPIEHFEALEQLRVLWHGYKICVTISEHPALPGVDTPEDLAFVRQHYI